MEKPAEEEEDPFDHVNHSRGYTPSILYSDLQEELGSDNQEEYDDQEYVAISSPKHSHAWRLPDRQKRLSNQGSYPTLNQGSSDHHGPMSVLPSLGQALSSPSSPWKVGMVVSVGFFVDDDSEPTFFQGKITSYDSTEKQWHFQFDDGDKKVYNNRQLQDAKEAGNLKVLQSPKDPVHSSAAHLDSAEDRDDLDARRAARSVGSSVTSHISARSNSTTSSDSAAHFDSATHPDTPAARSDSATPAARSSTSAARSSTSAARSDTATHNDDSATFPNTSALAGSVSSPEIEDQANATVSSPRTRTSRHPKPQYQFLSTSESELSDAHEPYSHSPKRRKASFQGCESGSQSEATFSSHSDSDLALSPTPPRTKRRKTADSMPPPEPRPPPETARGRSTPAQENVATAPAPEPVSDPQEASQVHDAPLSQPDSQDGSTHELSQMSTTSVIPSSQSCQDELSQGPNPAQYWTTDTGGVRATVSEVVDSETLDGEGRDPTGLVFTREEAIEYSYQALNWSTVQGNRLKRVGRGFCHCPGCKTCKELFDCKNRCRTSYRVCSSCRENLRALNNERAKDFLSAIERWLPLRGNLATATGRKFRQKSEDFHREPTYGSLVALQDARLDYLCANCASWQTLCDTEEVNNKALIPQALNKIARNCPRQFMFL